MTSMGPEQCDYVFKVLLVGDSAVGKSSLILRFKNQRYEDSNSPTIGVEYLTKFVTTKEETIKFAIWDTAGQERFRTLTRSYYRDSHGIIFVYDVTMRESFKNIKKIWMEEVKFHNTIEGSVKLIIGNKVDLESIREVTTQEGQEFASQNGCLFVETSAKNDTSVSLAFEELLKKFKETPSLMKTKQSGFRINIISSRKNLNRGCC